jgi:tRNA-dependent cyclodipeptide synthase
MRNKAYVGISLGSRVFSLDYLSRVIKYCSGKYEKLLFLLADTPHVYTFMAIKGIPRDIALGKIQEISIQKIRFLKKVIAKTHGADKFVELKRWDEISQKEGFNDILRSVYLLNEQDAEFHQDIYDIFDSHVKNLGYENLPIEAYSIGTRYVLDEFAIMLFLQERCGYTIQISPFEAPVYLAKYYAGKYKEVVGLPKITSLRPLQDIVLPP